MQKMPDADLACFQELDGPDGDAPLNASRKYVIAIYDPKSKFKETHASINKLRIRLASTCCMPIA